MSNEIATDFTPETPSAPAESLGAWFALVRASHGLEPREAARHLMLNSAIVQAIEADDFARLGPPVFARGYLSRYARLLDMPDQEVLERFQQQTGSRREDPPPLQVVLPLRRQARARDLRGLAYLVVLVGIGWTAIQHLPDLDPGWLAGSWSGDRPATGSSTVQELSNAGTQVVQYPFQPGPVETPAPAPITSLNRETAPTASPLSASVPPTVAAPAPTTIVTSPPNSASATSAFSVSGVQPITAESAAFAIRTSDPGAPANQHEEAKLLLEFSNDCWVEIRDAEGNVLTSSLMKANTTHTLSGLAPFKVKLGNAPAARIMLDDRLVDTTTYLPLRGTVSRFTLGRE
ncbi:MAG: hypothetical protein QG599_169 [Pseudomonadota bacterium]|nr:hypothetical protein [Pseudomonadota bacterium]